MDAGTWRAPVQEVAESQSQLSTHALFPSVKMLTLNQKVARGRRKGESNLKVEKVIAFADIVTNKNQKRVDLTTILLCQQFYLLTKNRASVKERCIHTLSLIGAHGLWVFDESIC